MNITVFDAEKADGLEELVAKATMSMAAVIKPSDIKEISEEIRLAIASANKGQKDLYYKHAVLASVGWNANDDVFIKEDTWAARNSSVDKQINLEHNELNIVGHMTDSYVFGADGQVIPDNTPLEQVPDKFDIVNEFVLYKLWDNNDKAQAMSKIISEIENGEWFVSMECRFPAFDYALIDQEGNQKVVARDKSTAFLTKYLRAYGGSGEYKNFKIGRLFRNFFFSGQGIVKVPANKRSIIFDIETLKPFKSQGSLQIKDKRMTDIETELAAAKAELERVKNAEVEALKSAKATIETEFETYKSEVSAALAAKETAIANLVAELTKANEDLAQAKAKADCMEKESKKAARKNKLAKAGVKDEELDAVASKWESVDDTLFDTVVEMYAAKTTANEVVVETPVVETPVVVETVVETPVVEEVKVEEEAPLNQSTASTADLVTKISEYFEKSLPYSAKANKRNK